MSQIVVTSNYRVTIPKDIRERARLRPGDRLSVSLHGRVIQLAPMVELEDLFGAFPNLEPFEREDEDREFGY